MIPEFTRGVLFLFSEIQQETPHAISYFSFVAGL
jgi:hypothetical protein